MLKKQARSRLEKGSTARATSRACAGVLVRCDKEWLPFPKHISLQSGGSRSEVKIREDWLLLTLLALTS